ncbi:NAD(P)H-dependent flavin oxidoreductase [Heyndrickxia acidicola]|uniref:Probable nitronate monooxygenase n=1 Tax=Heyndrickxia acidicola TaxID=209389 RepID=A0ABU6ME93_9BACI|nr:nitronate monooxygenase [Heyndrickxia acidicola]MED1202976.1 nitronate monooxygenase [Heyndrickxia acidicola]
MDLKKILGIDRPIIQGGMGNISNALLTSAVSNAGGLGTIGAGTRPPAEVERIIQETKARTDRPFALNIALSVSPHTKELMLLAEKYQIPVISLSAGNPVPYIPFLHQIGAKVMAVTGSVKHALKAEAAGADVIVAEGVEAAGINSPYESTTMVLIPQITDAVTIPVVAAGGIADGRGMLAAFSLGAQGVQLGTRFIATKEAPFASAYKERIVGAGDTSTIIIGRTLGRIRRVLDGPFAKRIAVKEKSGLSLEEYEKATTEMQHCLGALEGNEEDGFMNSGQIAGLIKDIPSVQELLDQIEAEYRTQLEKLAGVLPVKNQADRN